MATLTTDDLRVELQHFAENTLQSQLADLAMAIREGVRSDSQHIISSSLRSCQLLQSVRSPPPAPEQECKPPALIELPIPEPSHLPGQPPDVDTIQDVCSPNSKFDKGRAEEKQSSRLKEAWGSTSSRNESEDTVKKVEYDESTMSIHTLVPTNEYMAEELKELGYYKSVTNKLPVITESMKLRDTANQLMLHGRTPPGADSKTDILATVSVDAYIEFVNHSLINRMICSDTFEQGILFVIGLNTMFLAVETEVAVSDYALSQTVVFKVIDLAFLIVFALELGVRIYVFRCSFFKGQTPYGRKNQQQAWNIFDFLIVGVHALEMLFVELSSEQGSVLGSIMVLRLFRILRIGRLFRMRKILRLFKFLRIIVTSIVHSISAFFWALVLLEVIIFVFAVYFTELTAIEAQSGDDGEDNPEMRKYFGSLLDSQLSLLKAVTGGIDWGDMEKSLRSMGFMSAMVPFLGYLMFMLIVTMNVFTGIFLDAASQRAQHEREVHLVKAAHQIFKASDFDNSDKISRLDFERNLSHPDVNEFFEAIDLDIQQAEILFTLLDSTGDGVVSYDEFLRGCMRLRGTAKALDLMILSHDVNHLFEKIGAISTATGESLRMNRRMLSELHALAKANGGVSPKVHDL